MFGRYNYAVIKKPDRERAIEEYFKQFCDMGLYISETMKSEGFGKLKNPTARAAFMGGIANEIDTLIKKMVKSFNDKGL